MTPDSMIAKIRELISDGRKNDASDHAIACVVYSVLMDELERLK